VYFVTVKACNKRSVVINFCPGTVNQPCILVLLAVLVTEGTLDINPFAYVPQAALHLATLGHLNTIERVAMTAEESSKEVVLATELASSKVKLLPPILMVAVLQPQSILGTCITFAWICTLGVCQVVQSITSSIALDPNHQIILLASGPAPFVKRTRPVRYVLVLAAWLLAQSSIVEVFAVAITHTFANHLVAITMIATVSNAVLVTAREAHLFGAFTTFASSTMVGRITHTHASLLPAFTTALALNPIATVTTLVVLAGLAIVVVLIALAVSDLLAIDLLSHALTTVVAS